MSDRIQVRPAREGVKVAIPNQGRFLDAAGEGVQPSQYWYRALRRGDIVLVDAPPPAPDPKPAPRRTKKES